MPATRRWLQNCPALPGGFCDGMKQRRYFASLLSVATSDASDHKPLYDETFLVVVGSSELVARLRAEKYGRESEHEYESVTGEQITWKFLEVIDLVECIDQDLNNDVVELHGRFLRDIESFNRLRTMEE